MECDKPVKEPTARPRAHSSRADAVDRPLVLSRELSEHIYVEPHTSFHDPFPREQWGRLFEWEEAFPDAYCHHLWESVAWHLHLADLTTEKITTGRGSYHALARRFL